MLARGMHLKGDYEKAIEEYEKVIEQFPKTEEAAEAYYRLGFIYQDDLGDLDKAKESFNNSTSAKRNSRYYSRALAKSETRSQ